MDGPVQQQTSHGQIDDEHNGEELAIQNECSMSKPSLTMEAILRWQLLWSFGNTARRGHSHLRILAFEDNDSLLWILGATRKSCWKIRLWCGCFDCIGLLCWCCICTVFDCLRRNIQARIVPGLTDSQCAELCFVDLSIRRERDRIDLSPLLRD
jgi:hypothetical protein